MINIVRNELYYGQMVSGKLAHLWSFFIVAYALEVDDIFGFASAVPVFES